METLVECLSIVAVSIAAVLIVFVVSAAIVAVVEEAGKDEEDPRTERSEG